MVHCSIPKRIDANKQDAHNSWTVIPIGSSRAIPIPYLFWSKNVPKMFPNVADSRYCNSSTESAVPKLQPDLQASMIHQPREMPKTWPKNSVVCHPTSQENAKNMAAISNTRTIDANKQHAHNSWAVIPIGNSEALHIPYLFWSKNVPKMFPKCCMQRFPQSNKAQRRINGINLYSASKRQWSTNTRLPTTKRWDANIPSICPEKLLYDDKFMLQ